MVSRGGVYSWLRDVLPVLQSEGWLVGLLWSIRVDAPVLPATWSRRVSEPESRLGRIKTLATEVRAAVGEFEPDLLVSVLPQADVACARIVRRRDSLVWLPVVHGRPAPTRGEVPFLRRVAWERVMRATYSRAPRAVAVSHALADELRTSFGAPDTRVVHNGVHPAIPHRGVGRQAIGYLGRLAPEKAPEVFVQVARDLGVEARMFGAGPLEALAVAADTELPNFTYAGWTDRDEALRQMNVLVVPSRREALPLAVLEAGARRICVVARNVGGVGEVLGRDELLARYCLVPENTQPERFAASVGTVLANHDLRRHLGERLHALVRDRFSLPRQAVLFSGELHAALDRQHSSAEFYG